jgi:hypothetical protein
MLHGASAAPSWSDARFLRRTMMSLKELLHYGVGDERRSLYAYHYTGDVCQSSSAVVAASTVPASPHAVAALQRSPTFQLPEVSLEYRGNVSWSCDLHDDCAFSHSSNEAAYHFSNYKRLACRINAHLRCYPLHIQLEMGAAPLESGMQDDLCAELHRCPFYHSFGERDAWEAWRGAYLGFCPSERGSSAPSQQLLMLHPTYVRMRAALESIFVRMSCEARRVDVGDVGALALNPVDVLVLAAEMGESCTHRALCFMMFAEYAMPNVVLAWPDSNISAALHVHPESVWASSALAPLKDRHGATCVVVDPLMADVLRFVTTDHLCAIGEWLVMAASLVGSDCVIPLKFFPHCTHEPFAHSVPHRYYTYLALVVSSLTSNVQHDGQTLRPLAFLLHVSAAVVLGLSHWVVSEGWIKRRAVDVVAVRRYLDAHQSTAAQDPPAAE